MTIKISPQDSGVNTDFFRADVGNVRNEVSGLMQHADVKISKVVFGDDTSKILFLGKYRGRCISMWKREPAENLEPYKVLTTKNVDSDPNDVINLAPNKICVGFADGSLGIMNTEMEDIVSIKRIKSVHDGCASSVLERHEDSILSASINGTVEKVSIETGNSTTIIKGQSSIGSMCTTFGGQLLATGSSMGQLSFWDLRISAENGPSAAAQILVPSKKALDSVTALCAHPAQSNLICCGTDDGIIGLVDVRNGNNAMISSTYLVGDKRITQVMFHPTCSDNLLCSSNDGSLLRVDASGVPVTTHHRTIKDNVWLNGDVASSLRVEPIHQDTIYPISSFDCRGDTIVASSSIGLINVFENLPFFPTAVNNAFGRF